MILLIEITDQLLDKYIIEELFPLWEKFGKALKLQGSFLDDINYNFPADSAEQFKQVLRKWKETADHPTAVTLNKILEIFGFKNLIPQNTGFDESYV